VFFGTFNHAIDAKGRTSLPAKLREGLEKAGEARIFLMQNPYAPSVIAMPQSVWNKVTERVMAASPLDAKWQRNILKLYSTAQEVDLDVHGRVLVPPPLRAWAKLQKDVVWVGMGSVIHLWDRAEHEAQMAAELSADDVVDVFGGR
jgi:MraZ protein